MNEVLGFLQWLIEAWELRPRDTGWLIAAWLYWDMRSLRRELVRKLDTDTSATQAVATNLETLRMAVEALRESTQEEKAMLGRLLDRLNNNHL